MKKSSWSAVSLVTSLLVACSGPSPNAETTPAAPQKPKLKFSISVPKDEVASGASITVTMRLTNVSDETLLVNSLLGVNAENAPSDLREVLFTVIHESGIVRKFNSAIKRFPSTEYQLLKPGASIETAYELSNMYSFAEPGKYLVQALYENVQSPEKNTWGVEPFKGKVASNTLTIKVVK